MDSPPLSPLPDGIAEARGIGEEPFFTIRGEEIAVLPIPGASDGGPPLPSRLRKILRQAEHRKESDRDPDWSEPSPEKETRLRDSCERRDACLIWIFPSQACIGRREAGLHTMRFTDPGTSPSSTNREPREPLSINRTRTTATADSNSPSGTLRSPPLPSTEPESQPAARTGPRRETTTVPNGASQGDGSPASMDPEDWIASQVVWPNGRSRWMGWCFPGGLFENATSADSGITLPRPWSSPSPTPSRLFRLTELLEAAWSLAEPWREMRRPSLPSKSAWRDCPWMRASEKR